MISDGTFTMQVNFTLQNIMNRLALAFFTVVMAVVAADSTTGSTGPRTGSTGPRWARQGFG